MKNLLYILPLLLLPIFGLAQGQTAKEPVKKENTTFKNQIDLGFEILAPSFSYTRKVSNNIRIGTGFGFGLALGFASSISTPKNQGGFNFQDGIIEGAHIGVVIEFKLNQYFYYELKFQSASLILDLDALGSSFSIIGLKNGFIMKLNKVKLGFNLFVGKTETDKWLFYIQPLQLKIPLQW